MTENGSTIRGADITDGLNFLEDAMSVHFANIRAADSCFGYDHADILKRHIDKIVENDPSLRAIAPSSEPVEEVALLPSAIARFAPRATFDPPPHLGLFGTLPGEIREIIYRYVLSADYTDYIDLENCSCVRQSQRCKSGVALLLTCGYIYNEAVPILYGSDVFGIQVGYVETDFEYATSTWFEPIIYRQTTFDTRIVRRLPHNALHLIQHLDIEFSNDATVFPDEKERPFLACTHIFERKIRQICTLLKDCTQLNSLDITIRFGCKFADIDYMTRLIEPMMMLRSIKHPSLTVHAFQQNQHHIGFLPPDEPRWHLHHEFEDFLYDLLRSPHGTPTPPTDHLEVFHDGFEKGDLDLPGAVVMGFVDSDSDQDDSNDVSDSDTSNTHTDPDQFVRNYLRDVYDTDDLEALHGGLPARWQIFLNSEHYHTCDWMESIDPGHGELVDTQSPRSSD